MLEPGQIFAARYRVIRRIAEGGMGAIFEAEHTATERRVALKLLFPHIMSVASARKKFELEAKISARVNSPNIVEVLDAGFDEGTKSPFLVMELLEGQTLAHHVRERGALGVEQALPLLAQVAAGLDAAHGYKEGNRTAKPIVHRDLKPENLFLAREHGVYGVKILDFGIAKVLGETGNISQEVRGTPLYMAFEQVTAGPLSPQTDVWALGLIAYFMLTGRHYWRSANEPSANVQSLFAEILSLPLEAPSARLRQQRSLVQLPPAFDTWLLECIQREPARRFASAGAAIEALAVAFGRSAKSRARDSKPTPSFVFASTASFQTAPEAAPKQMSTAASLPGVATEGASQAPPARAPKRKPWLPAAAAGGVVVLAGMTWLALGPDDRAGVTATPVASSADARGKEPRQEPAPHPASSSAEPPVKVPGPTISAVSAVTTPPGEPSVVLPHADPATMETPSLSPQVHIAPHDEPAAAPDVAPVAPHDDEPLGARADVAGSAELAGETTSNPPLANPPTVTPAPASAAAVRPAAANPGGSGVNGSSASGPGAAAPGGSGPRAPGAGTASSSAAGSVGGGSSGSDPGAAAPSPGAHARGGAARAAAPVSPPARVAPASPPAKATTPPAAAAPKKPKNSDAYRVR